MSPRPYQMSRRQKASEETRERILEAARRLITDDIGAFSVEAVAAEAGVARMTVYYQFGSKAGLLEEVFNDRGGHYFRDELPAVTRAPEPLAALDKLIDVFFRFWAAERLVVRRIRGVGALDPAFDEALRGRDERRRMFLRMVLTRIAERYGRPEGVEFDDALDIVDVLSSFQTYDSLATEARSTQDTVALVQGLARRALGIDVDGASPPG